MEKDLFRFRWCLRPGLAVDNESQLAVSKIDIAGTRLWLPAAVAAGRRKHQRLALWTRMQLGFFATLALLVPRVLCTSIDIERPFDAILGKSVPIDGPRVIEDGDILLRRRWP